MNPITAANTITQERTVESVTFPLTGDPELDAISGIKEVIRKTIPALDQPGFVTTGMCNRASRILRCLKYLTDFYQDQKPIALTGAGLGHSDWPPTPQSVPPNPWYTTSDGTIKPLMDQIQQQTFQVSAESPPSPPQDWRQMNASELCNHIKNQISAVPFPTSAPSPDPHSP